MDLNFYDLLNAESELELMPVVKRAVASYGAEWFVFVSLHPTDHSASRSTYRFLIGCRPEWCQLYNANRWYMTDPCLEYARVNTAPVLGSDLPVQTSGQKYMLEVAATNGFRSIYIVPAHANGKGRIGVLYLGSDLPRNKGEPIFHQGRSYFRLLALELLDWSTRAVRAEAMRATGLMEDETRVMSLVKRGFIAAAIAEELGVSVVTIYRKFQRINEKIGVTRISEAIKFAEEHELLA
ncbi:autoinducer binding domain-containing protein [Cupriavidus necator]